MKLLCLPCTCSIFVLSFLSFTSVSYLLNSVKWWILIVTFKETGSHGRFLNGPLTQQRNRNNAHTYGSPDYPRLREPICFPSELTEEHRCTVPLIREQHGGEGHRLPCNRKSTCNLWLPPNFYSIAYCWPEALLIIQLTNIFRVICIIYYILTMK